MNTLKQLHLDGPVLHYYKEGRKADESDNNPYSRATQSTVYHAWEAGYCDKYGHLSWEYNL